jgi:hypothetical protein
MPHYYPLDGVTLPVDLSSWCARDDLLYGVVARIM